MADNALSFATSWADQDGACEPPTNIDVCEVHPERKPWAQKGKESSVKHRYFMRDNRKQ